MHLASMPVSATPEGAVESPLLKTMCLGAYDPEPVPWKRPRPLKLFIAFKADAERFLSRSTLSGCYRGRKHGSKKNKIWRHEQPIFKLEILALPEFAYIERLFTEISEIVL